MSESLQSLEDVLNGVEQPEPEAAPVEEAPTAEPEAAPVAETQPEPEAAKDEGEPAAPKAEPEAENWTKAAVLDERRKRQALQAELDQLRQANQEQVKAPDIFEDQAGYADFITQQVSQQVFQNKVEMSQEFMRSIDSDYDSKESQFYEMAQKNPLLVEQVRQHPMPARFVVETVNKANELKELSNVEEYKAKLRAEVEAEIKQKMQAEFEAKTKQQEQVSSITPSLANARSNASNSDSHIEQSLSDIFGGR